MSTNNPRLHVWQTLNNTGESDDNRRTCRMTVPGGWLYRAESWGENEIAVALAFVPDNKDRGR
jgi:hypothetical protein